MHRHDFGLSDAPAGACILYAVGCNLSERDLIDQDLLVRSGNAKVVEDDEDTDEVGDDEGDTGGAGGSLLRLKPWNKRTRPTMGHDPLLDRFRANQKAAGPSLFEGDDTAPAHVAPRARAVPLIDMAHRLMHLWHDGESEGVINEYIDLRGLRRNGLFKQVLQALVELSPEGSDERALLEKISNQIYRTTAQPAMAL